MSERSLISVYLKLLFTAFFKGTFIAEVIKFSTARVSGRVLTLCDCSDIFDPAHLEDGRRIFAPAKKHQLLPLSMLGMTGVFAYNFSSKDCN